MTHEELIKTVEYNSAKVEICLFNVYKRKRIKKKAKKHSKTLVFGSGYYNGKILKIYSEADYMDGYMQAIEDISEMLNIKLN